MNLYERTFLFFAWISIFAGIIAISFYVAVSVWPYNPLEIDEPISIHEDVVHQGGHVVYDIPFCKYADKPSHVQRYLSNGLDVQLSSIVVNNPVGCETVTLHIDIPECTPPGEYTIRHVATYDYPFGRDVTVRYETEPFQVIKL